MRSKINAHQLEQIFSYLGKDYLSFGTKKSDGKLVFDTLSKATEIVIPTPKTTIPFKKILFPNGLDLTKNARKKYAFWGLANCDALALDIFLKEFAETDLLPERKDIFVISTECQPDEFCFCTAIGDGKIENFDLHLEKDSGEFLVSSGSKQGEDVLKFVGIKNDRGAKELPLIPLEKARIDRISLTKGIANREGFADFWQGISNNCFSCGACTAVCPLCFCTRKDFENKATGECAHCLRWDACFSKSFSEIQGHLDYRPEPVDRLYNWYHHKFKRAYEENRHFLCTGCGRCIKACPAGLNQYRILSAISKKKEISTDGTK